MKMIDHKLHQAIDRFLAIKDCRNAWLDGQYLSVYLRKEPGRWLSQHEPVDIAEWRAKRIPCIEIGNIRDTRIEFQLRGTFPGFMDYLESKPFAIYIELVQLKPLQWYYERRGYLRDPLSSRNTPSYYRLYQP